jgi:putative hemolysin
MSNKEKALIVVGVVVLLLSTVFGGIFVYNSFFGGRILEKRVKVFDFESCLEAGYDIMESYPRQCSANGETYVEVIPVEELDLIDVPVCENMCGDGICQEIVCMGTGCPCAETQETCPVDCGGGEDSGPTGLGNPASLNCFEKGYDVELREEEDGEVGYCINKKANKECEEWAFLRGECSL